MRRLGVGAAGGRLRAGRPDRLTWGMLMRMTWGFWDASCEEAHALLSDERKRRVRGQRGRTRLVSPGIVLSRGRPGMHIGTRGGAMRANRERRVWAWFLGVSSRQSARVWLLLAATWFGAGQSPTAAAGQNLLPACPPTSTLPRAKYPAGRIKVLVPEGVDILRKCLDSERWSEALSYFFGDIYLASLPDVVIYIDHSGGVHQAMIQDNSVRSGRVLRGPKYIYVYLFSAIRPHDSGVQSADPRPDSLEMLRTSIDYQIDPFLTRFLGALLSKLAITVGAPPSAPDSTLMVHVPLVSIGPGRVDATELFLARYRFSILPNSWDRITVQPIAGQVIPGSQSIVSNFANADASALGLGVGFFATFHARTLKNDSLAGESFHTNMYFLAHVYLSRPELPRRGRSSGFVLGTNLLGGSLFSELLAGYSVDRIWNDVGLAVGVNFLKTEDTKRRSTWEPRWFAGLTLPL